MSTKDTTHPERDDALVPDLTPTPLGLRKILVPTDFSSESYAALRRALDLGKQFNSEIVLVHVVEPIPNSPVSTLTHAPGDLPPDPMFDMGYDAETVLIQLGKEAAAKSQLPVKTVLLIGRAYDQIVRAAQENHADVIVIPTHGYTGLRHVLLGSTAEKVVRHATCPVLVLRCQEEGAA